MGKHILENVSNKCIRLQFYEIFVCLKNGWADENWCVINIADLEGRESLLMYER